jgi:transcriptional regulator with XRE-family HTH domain
MEWKENSLEIIAKNVHKERTERGWSREKLADVANVSEDTIKNIEHGKDVKLITYGMITNAFECPFDKLICDDEADILLNRSYEKRFSELICGKDVELIQLILRIDEIILFFMDKVIKRI